MANFETAIVQLLKNEGEYVNDPQDSGGETYKGVARKYHSKWEGWIDIDLAKAKPNFPQNLEDNDLLQTRIKHFYEVNYWDKLQCDSIESDEVAMSIFDFGVNAGVKTSAKLAQLSVGATPDGIIGSKTLQALNDFDKVAFIATFTVAKIARYVNLCEKNPKNRKFFYGWVRRALKGA